MTYTAPSFFQSIQSQFFLLPKHGTALEGEDSHLSFCVESSLLRLQGNFDLGTLDTGPSPFPFDH